MNGKVRELELDTRTTLLDALREHLHLTGSKKGCDQGQCGACTVIAGRRFYFNEPLQMEGTGRAKNLLEHHANRVLPIELPEAACDLDTPEDVADFVQLGPLNLPR